MRAFIRFRQKLEVGGTENNESDMTVEITLFPLESIVVGTTSNYFAESHFWISGMTHLLTRARSSYHVQPKAIIYKYTQYTQPRK